jgi:hypothetical protein
MSARKISTVSATEMGHLADHLSVLFERFAQNNEMTQQGLCKFARAGGIVDRKLTISEVKLVFERVKLGKRTTLNFERFQEAVRVMGNVKGVTYQEIIEIARTNALAEISVLIGTWNVGNSQPPDELDPWIPTNGGGFDVIAVGAQESNYETSAIGAMTRGVRGLKNKDNKQEALEPAATTGKADVKREGLHAEHFFRLLQIHIGDDYEIVSAVTEPTLKEMRLVVFAHKRLMPLLNGVETARANTGIGNMLGNKGGLMVKLDIAGTTLGFTSCHLAPHDGEKKVVLRNQMIGDILDRARVGSQKLQYDNQLHHNFWFGDMNYRVDPLVAELQEQQEKQLLEQQRTEEDRLIEVHHELTRKTVRKSALEKLANLVYTTKRQSTMHVAKSSRNLLSGARWVVSRDYRRVLHGSCLIDTQTHTNKQTNKQTNKLTNCNQPQATKKRRLQATELVSH